jgi:hypothetical protein
VCRGAGVELVELVRRKLAEDLVVDRLGVRLHLRMRRVLVDGVLAEDGLVGTGREVGLHLLVHRLHGLAVGLERGFSGREGLVDRRLLGGGKVEGREALLHLVMAPGHHRAVRACGRALLRGGGRRDQESEHDQRSRSGEPFHWTDAPFSGRRCHFAGRPCHP